MAATRDFAGQEVAAVAAKHISAGQARSRWRDPVAAQEDEMTEVRRHQRRTASGKTTTVRHHERGTGAAAERKREAWEDRAAQRWTPPPRADANDPEPVDEGWWDDDVPRPEAWTDNDDAVEYDGHVFNVNRAPVPRPQGDYDFRDPA